MPENFDVAVIGAGPSGAVAAAMLVRSGYRVVVLERNHFPRFSIGESLLPQCMTYFEQAGMLEDIQAGNFQYKDGALFACKGEKAGFEFEKKFSEGYGTTFQVERAKFDKILADNAAKQGVDIRYGMTVEDVAIDENGKSSIRYVNEEGVKATIDAKFVLDASGFGRVLPRLLDLNTPSNFPMRQSWFTHIEDNISDSSYDRNKILIVIHPEVKSIWYWLIPFTSGRCSVGVVCQPEDVAHLAGNADEEVLKTLISESPDLVDLLANAKYDTRVNAIKGYSAGVKQLWGKGYALLGNAGEFLDPVFSSGVTIAVKSANLAATLVARELEGETVDWEKDFSTELRVGVDTFRTYVEGWYDETFQQVIFAKDPNDNIKAMICSILAGYAWDEKNPYVKQHKRRLKALAELCA